MDLQAQALATIEPLDEERKRPLRGEARSHDGSGLGLQDAPKRLPVKASADQDRLRFGAVDELPTLADRPTRWEGPAKGGLKRTTAPDAVLINGLETEQFVHGKVRKGA